MVFEFIDIILFLGIGQGILLIYSHYKLRLKDIDTSKLLMLLVLMAMVMLVGRFFFVRYPRVWPLQWTLLPDVVIFLFGPVCYTFIARLCFESKERPFRLPFYHYLPALLQFGFFVYCLSYSRLEFYSLSDSGQLSTPYLIIEGMAITLNLIYWTMTYLLLGRYGKAVRNVISSAQKLRTFLQVFMFAIFACLISWLASYTGTYFLRYYNLYINYDIVWVCIPAFIYLIGYYSIKEPRLFRIPLDPSVRDNPDRLNEQEISQLNQRLIVLFEKEKIYLESELTLGQLSEKMSASKHDVSWLLNHVHRVSFYEYVNAYRVREFLERATKQEQSNLTIFGLALESGFSSKSTFNKAFKSQLNDTPSNYLKKMLPKVSNV